MKKKREGKLDQILHKLDNHDKRFDGIAKKLLDHDVKFDKLDTKIDNKFGEVLNGLDKVMGELEKAREDRVTAQKKDKEQDLRLEVLEKSLA